MRNRLLDTTLIFSLTWRKIKALYISLTKPLYGVLPNWSINPPNNNNMIAYLTSSTISNSRPFLFLLWLLSQIQRLLQLLLLKTSFTKIGKKNTAPENIKKIICLEHGGRNLFVTRWYLTQENQRCLLKAKTVATKQT